MSGFGNGRAIFSGTGSIGAGISASAMAGNRGCYEIRKPPIPTEVGYFADLNLGLEIEFLAGHNDFAELLEAVDERYSVLEMRKR
jgi:hypothetical protein